MKFWKDDDTEKMKVDQRIEHGSNPWQFDSRLDDEKPSNAWSGADRVGGKSPRRKVLPVSSDAKTS
jgi:hypothetical protein